MKWGKGTTSFMYQILDVPCRPLLMGGIIDQILDSIILQSEAPLCGRSKEPDVSDSILFRAASSSSKL